MIFLINGLFPSIQTIVACYQEIQPRLTLTYNAFVQITLDEGELFRPQARTRREIRKQKTRNWNVNTTTINLIDKSESSTEDRTNGLKVIRKDGTVLESIPTKYIPSTDNG